MTYTIDKEEIIDKVFAISHAMTECRYWIDMEETNNYLTEHDVKEGRLGFLPIHVDYIGNLIEEMFSWSIKYDKYTGNMGDVVADGFYSGDLTPEKIRDMFHKDPLKAVSKPEYTGGYFDSPYTFNEGQFLDPEGLLDYLRSTNDHDLDIDEVEKVFKIGDYKELREEDNEEEA